MQTMLSGQNVAHIYRFKLWVRIFLWLGGMACFSGAFYLVFLGVGGPGKIEWGELIGAFLLTMIGALYVAGERKWKAVLDQESVTLTGVFLTKSLRKSAIAGRRTVAARYGTLFVLQPKSSEDKKLVVADFFKLDEEWFEWFYGLRDLDAEELNEGLQRIADDRELGPTPDLRMRALRRAKRIVAALTVLSLIAGLLPIFLQDSLDPILIRFMVGILVALPWVIIVMLVRWPKLYSPTGERNDPRPTPTIALFMCLGLWFSPIPNLQTESITNLLIFALLPAITLTVIVRPTVDKIPYKNAVLLLFLMMFLAYGCGLGRQIDTLFDDSPPKIYRSQVLGGRATHSKSASYYLDLSPWKTNAGTVEVDVTRSLWNSVRIGDSVCIAEHTGLLRVPWYTVQRCE